MILPMTMERAVEISHWKYKDVYSIYSFQPNDETINYLLNGDYYAVLIGNDSLLGFFCFGNSACIPTIEENVYDDDYLDIGLGMRPDLCGQGQGFSFMKSGLKFAQEGLKKNQLRLTVAAFNVRAIRVYEKIGFHIVLTVAHRKTGDAFYLMTLDL